MTIDNKENLIINIGGKTRCLDKNFVKNAIKTQMDLELIKLRKGELLEKTFCAQYNREQEEVEVNTGLVDNNSKGTKFDNQKTRMELLPSLALEKIAEIFTFGAKKYGNWNWSKGLEYSRLYGALQRHLGAWYKGEELDEETQKSHLHHAGCCLTMLIEMNELRRDLDDRPIHYKK